MVVFLERRRSRSGVPATAARKLVGFGPASWQRLKDILAEIAPPKRRRPRGQAKARPRPTKNSGRLAALPTPAPELIQVDARLAQLDARLKELEIKEKELGIAQAGVGLTHSVNRQAALELDSEPV